VAVPIVISAGAAVFVSANNGWYGYGWGDGGVELNVLAVVLCVLGAAAGVALGKIARGLRRRHG
jgi:hypothetical protein